MDLVEVARGTGRPLRILVTRLRYLGDILLTTPVVAALKRRYPDGEIFYLAESPHAEILERHPDLAGIIPLGRGAARTFEAVRKLRRMRFVAALDLFYNPRSAWLLFAAGIPVRVGGSRRWRRRLYTDVFSEHGGARSAVVHHLDAARTLGSLESDGLPRVYLAEEELEEGRRTIRTVLGPHEGGPVVAIHPGGTWPAKRWPARSFALLAGSMRDSLGARILVVVGAGEEPIGAEVAVAAGRDTHLLPRLRIRALASVLSHCDMVVANDGGVMHLSVALGRPTVGVFGPTEPDIWFPYQGKGPFVLVTRGETCAPCHKHLCEEMKCLELIEPEEVMAAVAGLHAEAG